MKLSKFLIKFILIVQLFANFLFKNLNKKNTNLLSKNRGKNNKFTSKRRYLSEFSSVQKSIDKEHRNSFISNEKTIIKNYGAVYVDNGKFYLTNEKNSKGKKLAEMFFHKTIMTKG